MNKKILKKILIFLAIDLLSFVFIKELIDNKNIFDALIMMVFSVLFDIDEIESILTILGTVLLVIGILLKSEILPPNINDSEKSIKKYKILKIIGYIPFIGILFYGIYSSIVGFTFFYTTDYGIAGFFEAIFFTSFLLWPVYVVGITLIIKSSANLKYLKEM